MSEDGFVVGVDRQAVMRRREVVSTVLRRGAWATLVIGAIGILGAVYVLITMRYSGLWPFALLLILAMLPLVISTVLALRLDTERQRWYAAFPLQDVAMRMTDRGLELACDGAGYPVMLPWATVQGFQQKKLFGQYMLELSLAPGVGATTAGVRGLDQPAVRAVVKPSPLLHPIGMFLVKALDQPVHVIDQALKHYSNGNAGVRN
ncbi:hypothetical protein HPO96_06945 [Kribbella sandramycini]|uniref:Uncharacterized protein n=1 Tax=Kribbella sandramycini TaxID=60450 RepID=A0A7Y4KWG5_9ACTN|nr:hypothetical protein [Kribbella sandramycini]MBB6567414.1 hypothetical protein [Kribbella sandramycini]NOL39975.1 hypothetical protein [Kribbella sandramycini]